MKELDMRKKQCPMPVIEAKKALDKAEAGEVIAVRVDNEIAVENLRKLAAGRQEKAERKDLGPEDFVVEITAGAGAGLLKAQGAGGTGAVKAPEARETAGKGSQETAETAGKGSPDAAETAEEDSPETASLVEKGLVAVFSSDRMGEPEEELGKLLIKGFIYALTEMDRLPETVIFYNGGARLTTKSSDSLEDLKAMEAAGVEIITCGTCLKHLGLEGELKVGTVSNMYDIVERMTGAKKIVKP